MDPHLPTQLNTSKPKLVIQSNILTKCKVENSDHSVVDDDQEIAIIDESSEDEVDEAQFNLWLESQLKHIHKRF